jgi:quinolinate synthase
VSYVNTYADVKAETDICCTSGNAVAVVRHLLGQGHRRVIFLPDEYLAKNVADELGIGVVAPASAGRPLGGVEAGRGDPEAPALVVWRGRCEVHEKFTVEDIAAVRKQFPDAVVLCHPECSPEVVRASDFSGSTTELIRRVEQMQSGRYLLLTECSMGDNIASRNPDRQMIRLCSIRCPHMNEITLEQTLESLRQLRHVVEVPEEISRRARASLDRMIGIG